MTPELQRQLDHVARCHTFSGAHKYEVIDAGGKSHGDYDTLEEARGCAAYDRLRRGWSIWYMGAEVAR